MSFRKSVTGVWRSFDPAEQELSVVHPFFIERDINIKNVFTLKSTTLEMSRFYFQS